MKKKALMVSTILGFLTSFEMSDICILQQLGYEVHCACNCDGVNDKREKEDIIRCGAILHHIPFKRFPISYNNITAYKELERLIATECFDLVHCHTPVGGVLGRMAAHKNNVSTIIYTAHGFHFYDGAPLKNWLIYYPVEKYYSKYTDILVTINKEDYKRATEHFKAKKTVYIPGVGVDTEKFASSQSGRERIRNEFELKETDIVLLSVGELNSNKNHCAVIEAISGMNVVYIIAGAGEKKAELERLAKEYKVDLKLAGFRKDVADFYAAADVYVLPSIREGLNVSLMEAMASGLAVACGRIRGNIDLIEDDEVRFDPLKIEEIKKAVSVAVNNRNELGQKNKSKVNKFSISVVGRQMQRLYADISE